MKERELRLLLTQKCNFNCSFCHKEGILNTKKELLNAIDYDFVFNSLRSLYGWTTVSITGGEPLCCKNLINIIELLHKSNAKITLVSNGSMINMYPNIFQWLEKLTVSVHTTNNQKYQNIIGCPYDFNSLKENLLLVRNKNNNLHIRFNCTIVKGLNSSENDVLDIINFAESINCSVKFIELLPNTTGDEKLYVPIEEIEQILLKHNYKLTQDSILQKIYTNKKNIIVLSKIVCSISRKLGTSSPHCTETNSIFLASDGTIKPCMKNSLEINVLKEIKDKNLKNFEKKMQIFFNIVSTICPYEKICKI